MMTEDEALASMDRSGLIGLLSWAAPISFTRTGNDFDEDAGHDQAIIGLHNFVYMRDLLDRATSNGRYALALDATGAGVDFLARGIPPEAFSSMPPVTAGKIERRDYQQSPGWVGDGIRVLLQSFKPGHVDHIKWGQRSQAKQQVARQWFSSDVPLFADEEFGIESISGIPDDEGFVGVTLIAAHSYSPATGEFELYVGQSKNPTYRGDSCWYWRRQLLRGGGGLEETTVETTPPLPGSAPSGQAEDVGVQLRRPGSTGTFGARDV